MRRWWWCLPVSVVASFEFAKGPCVFYVTPTGWCDPSKQEDLVVSCKAAAAGGASAIQVRDHEASSSNIQAAARAVRSAVAGTTCRVVVNGYLEDAVFSGADGVHLRERWLSEKGAADFVSRARVAMNGGLVGCSAHSVESVLAAAKAGVDYVQIGTMFRTMTHPDKVEVEGPELVSAAVDALRGLEQRHKVKLIGVGGIDTSNCADVTRAGADGVAVIRAICSSRDPAGAVRIMLDSMMSSSVVDEIR